MKKLNISKRDVFFFFLGISIYMMINLVLNFEDAKQGFIDGYNSVKCCEDKK